MATILNLNDPISVRIEYTSEGNNKAYNVLHYSLKEVSVVGGGLWAGASMFDIGPVIALEMFDALSPTWQNTASQDVAITGVTVQNLAPPALSRQYTFTPPGAGLSGVIADEALPLQDAVTLVKQGETNSRKDLGRVFVPGCPEQGQSSGIITGAQADLYRAMAAAWSNFVTVTYLGDTLRFFPILFNPSELPDPVQRPVLEVVLSNSVLKTQRRRRPGKGI